MNKIVEAIKVMTANPKKITNVIMGVSSVNNEYFFLYDNKYKWSMIARKKDQTENYFLFYYPGEQSIEELASIERMNKNDYVTYRSQDFSSSEITQIFASLHSVVKGELYKINEALDEIIKGAS